MEKRIDVEEKFDRSRNNLLAVVLLSLANVILGLLNVGLSFPFSATFPIACVAFGQGISSELGNNMFLIIGIGIAFFSIALYGLCYILSKKHKAWILVSLILFSIDTLMLLGLFLIEVDISLMIEVAFHVWVIYYLVVGVKAWKTLKKMPLDEISETIESQEEANNEEMPETSAIRPETKKGRIIISQDFNDLKIVVKRVFGATELIVNGMVYAEKKGLVEGNYTLNIFIQDTKIEVTMDIWAKMCLYVDGNLLVKKQRMA